MEKLIFECKVKELKNHFTIEGTIEKEWGMKKPIMKKVLYGVEIKKPTSYRIYTYPEGSRRTWVFDDLEINPAHWNVDKISK
jgi:hypothetical protein